MNKLRALILLLLVSLGAWVGVTTYMTPEVTPAQPEAKPAEEQISVQPLGSYPETSRKLTIFPLGGLFTSLVGAKLNFLNVFTGGLFGGYGYARAPVVQETRVVNTVNVIPNLRSSLNGRYALNFPQINFEISENEFIFTGCNTHRIPYIYESSRFYFGKLRSTRNDCGFDSASLFVRQLGRLRRLGRRDNDIYFFDNTDTPLFGARFRKGPSKIRYAFAEIQQGFYDAQFPSYNVEVRDDRFWLQGCESDPVQFYFDRQGGVSFRRTFSDRDCYVDRRDIFNDFFTNSERIRFSNNDDYEFQDEFGTSIVSCSPYQWK